MNRSLPPPGAMTLVHGSPAELHGRRAPEAL